MPDAVRKKMKKVLALKIMIIYATGMMRIGNATREGQMKQCKCSKCGYTWTPRIKGVPKSCPRCKRYDWRKKA